MTSKQLINHLCYEYGITNYNEEKLKTTQKIKKRFRSIRRIWNPKKLLWTI